MTILELIGIMNNHSLFIGFYHITDQENKESIHKHGLLSIKQQKILGIKTPEKRASNNKSDIINKNKGLDDYVSLSFFSEHNFVKTSTDEERIETPHHIIVSPRILLQVGVKFADGIANKNSTTILPIEHSVEQIYREIFLSGNAGCRKGSDYTNLARKAEILVPGMVPTNMLLKDR